MPLPNDLKSFAADDYENDFLQAGKDALVFGACGLLLILALVFA